MKLIIIVSVISISVLFGFFSKIAFFSSDVPDFSNNSKSIYDYSAVSIDGEEVKISNFKGKKIIIVNVASKCGYTYQYDGFQKLNEEFKDDVVILGFPSNDFLFQEPGDNRQIKQFCSTKYGVDFPMFAKTTVKKNKDQHPLYTWLSHSSLNGWNDQAPGWNFYKYLIDENGKCVNVLNASVKPMDDQILGFVKSENTK